MGKRNVGPITGGVPKGTKGTKGSVKVFGGGPSLNTQGSIHRGERIQGKAKHGGGPKVIGKRMIPSPKSK